MTKKKTSLPATIPAASQSAERFDRLEELSAGQYWRALADIPGIKATYTEFSRAGRKTNGRLDLKAGTVLLVKSLRHADGGLHTVVMAPHPLEADGEDRRYLAKDFFSLFERADDAQAVRQAEIGEVESQLARLQGELVKGPAEMPLIAPPAQKPSLGALVANAGAAEELKKRTQLSVEFAQRRADWVQGKVEELGVHTGTLARFHAEQATAALAIAEDTIRYANHLQTGIKTLGLYTGEGVEVTQLTSGEPAARDEKLTLYQRKLFLDEEFIVHLHDGGADHKDLEKFAEAISKDKSLLERIAPSPRSIVLMRYRRKDKEYFSGTDPENAIARAMANAFANEPNKATFLLVRNGENVYQVWSEIATDAAPRLFPTKEDLKRAYRQDGFFRGLDGDEITPDDLMYTEAQERHDALDLFYKRLLVLLWGLNDRLDMFGEFYDRKDGLSWLNIAFQRKNFRFVHDDEDALTDGRPSFADWRATQNKLAQPGSRILAIWNKVMTPESAPGACKWTGSRHESVEFKYKPTTRCSVAIARKAGRHLVVGVPCVYNGWRSSEDIKKNTKEIQVSIDRALKDTWSAQILCLDGVKSADLDYYLNSRRHRHDYLNYMESFFEARNHLRLEEREAKPFVDAVRAALKAAGVMEKRTAEEIDTAIEESIRLWRANRYGRKVPTPADKAFKATLTEIGQQIWRLLKMGGDPKSAVEAALEADGRVPLRLVSRGNGKLAAYAEPKADETIDVDGVFPWAMRMDVKIGKDGAAILGEPKHALMPAESAAERVLNEWPAASAWLAARPKAPRFEHRDLVAMKDWLTEMVAAPSMLESNVRMTDELFDTALDNLKYWTKHLTKKFVEEPYYTVPLGVIGVRPTKDKKVEASGNPASGKLYVLVAEARLSSLLWARATEIQRDKLEAWIDRTYKHTDKIIARTKERAADRSWLRFFIHNLAESKEALGQLKTFEFLGPDVMRGYQIRQPKSSAGWAKAIAEETKTYNIVSGSSRERDVRFLDWTPGWQAKSDAILKAWPAPAPAKEDED